ncbi:MAG: hypothetical protein ABI925_10495 [Verrucomicrobiota bacterium]
MVTNIPSATLRQLVKLTERKEALMAQIQEIDREMARLQKKSEDLPENTGHAAPVTVSRSARKPARRLRAT